MMDVEIKDEKQGHYNKAHKEIDQVALMERTKDFAMFALTEECSNYRRGGIGNAQEKIETEIEYVVDKACG